LARLERDLARLSALLEAAVGRPVASVPGAGAAGGMAAMLLALGQADLRPGIALVLEASGFDAALADADLVITGEGRLDGQSADGKTVSGVARAAAAAGVPVVAIAGAIGPGAEALYPLGVSGLLSLVPGPMGLEEAMDRTHELLADAAERLLRLVLALRGAG
jgi:glycerate kinase